MKCEKCGKELVLGLNQYYPCDCEKKKNEFDISITADDDLSIGVGTTCPNANLEVKKNVKDDLDEYLENNCRIPSVKLEVKNSNNKEL